MQMKSSRGGSGYAIRLEDGKEVYGEDKHLPEEVEHSFPDYSIYNIVDTAYGFLTRGCPRGCPFCHVAAKEGRASHQVADLSEFWDGQKNLILYDPNILACKNHLVLLKEILRTGAMVDLNQGIDCRLLTDENINLLKQMRMKRIHFAWDLMEQSNAVERGLKLWRENGKWQSHNMIVYVLCNYNTTFEEDLYRVYKLREMEYQPYIMLYDKEHCDKTKRHLARWTNNRIIWNTCERFEDYKPV